MSPKIQKKNNTKPTQAIAGSGKYILDAETLTYEPCEDLMQWAESFDIPGHVLAQTTFEGLSIKVSTIFLGSDHNYSGDGPPLVWETMIFGGERDEDMRRYATVEEAVEGHLGWCMEIALQGDARTTTYGSPKARALMDEAWTRRTKDWAVPRETY